MGHLTSSHVTDELPPLVVSLDHHLDLGVEVAVGQADHQTLGREQHTANYLKYILRPGNVGRTHDGDEVAKPLNNFLFLSTSITNLFSPRIGITMISALQQIIIDLPYFTVFTFAAFQCFLS